MTRILRRHRIERLAMRLAEGQRGNPNSFLESTNKHTRKAPSACASSRSASVNSIEALDVAIAAVKDDIRAVKFSKVYRLGLPAPIARLDTLETAREVLESLREVILDARPTESVMTSQKQLEEGGE